MENSEENCKIELEILKEKFKHQSEVLSQKEKELFEARSQIKQHLREKLRMIEQANELRTNLEIAKERIKLKEQFSLEKNKITSQKKKNKALQICLVSALFLLSSLSSGFGINLLTSNPSETMGTYLIMFAIFAYIIATLMTITTSGEIK